MEDENNRSEGGGRSEEAGSGREATDGKVKRRERMEEYERSGLTTATFARKAGINYPTFCSWVKKAEAGRAGAKGWPVFAEVKADDGGRCDEGAKA